MHKHYTDPIKHPETIEKYNGSLKELANDIARLRYDKIAELLLYLALEIDIESKKDFDGKRYKLSYALHEVSQNIKTIKEYFDHIWKICKPFMKE